MDKIEGDVKDQIIQKAQQDLDEYRFENQKRIRESQERSGCIAPSNIDRLLRVLPDLLKDRRTNVHPLL